MNGAPGGTNEEEGGLLSRRPRRLWPDAIVHHGVRVALLIALAVVITALFPPAERTRISRYTEGEIAEENLLAQVPFAIPKSAEELAREREEARAAVPPTFDYRPEASDSVAAGLERFFDRLDSLAHRDEQPIAAMVGSSRVDLQACKLEYSIVSPK